MSGKGRYGRPNRASLLAMMAANSVLATIVMTVALAIFGVHDIHIPFKTAALAHMAITTPWHVVWPMLPGAAVAFGCLWYWLVVVGRSHGVPWGGAAVYGLVIALVNVPVGGFIYGLLNGQPLFGMLILLVLLLLVPAWLLAVSLFGVVMGVLNGYAAQWWIGYRRR